MPPMKPRAVAALIAIVATVSLVSSAGPAAHGSAIGPRPAIDQAPPTDNPPQFAAHEIATGLRGGYQVLVTDLNADGKPDIIALASGMPELVWYQNPGWERH